MASSHELAIKVLASISGYRAEFKRVFGTDTITISEVIQALAALEETLITPNSRFDKWLLGDANALTVKELASYKLFKESGCVVCYNGAAATLTEAVDIMGRMQLGRKFTNNENAQIVAFLKTLMGDQPIVQLPVLPPSEENAPRPEPFTK